MIERRSGPAFAFEAAQHSRIVDQLFGDDLEGHEAPENRVLRLEHDSHGPAPDLFHNAVLRNHPANHRGAGRYCFFLVGGVVLSTGFP